MRRRVLRGATTAALGFALVVAATMVGLNRANAKPNIVTVDTAIDAFDGSCADGDCSLRDAVAAVATGGSIRIPAGYYPLGDRRLGSVSLRRAVRLEGTGAGGTFVDATRLGDSAFLVGSRTKPVYFSNLTILGAVIRHDPVPVAGAIEIDGGRATLDRLTVTGADTSGAAVTVGDPAIARVAIRRSLFLDNRSHGYGAAVNSNGRVRIQGTTFARNFARGSGAVDFGRGAHVLIRNSTFAGNGATLDGGAAGFLGTVALRSVSFVRNHAKRNGGAISGSAGAKQNITTRGVLFAGNTADGYGEQCSAPITSLGHNVEDETLTCRLGGPGDRPRADARVGGLNSFGGPTPTVSLHPGSDALNVGGVCPPTDQRGAPRSGRCDAGAYERVLCLGRAVNIVGTRGDDELSGGRNPDGFLGLGGDDAFQGSLGKDVACGGSGNDRLLGGPGPDHLSGGLGNDGLRGEGGEDILRSGSGFDRLNGGPDRDVCYLLDRGSVSHCEKAPLSP
jgi:predicted outer membrane repeat protein